MHKKMSKKDVALLDNILTKKATEVAFFDLKI